jgi:hypothetical protein
MLTVQTTMGRVERDRENENGSSQSRYQGYRTGAHKSDSAIGQANESAGVSEYAARDCWTAQSLP